MNNMLINYVRDNKGKPVATIVATEKNCVGVSICNPKDTFNKAMGIKIAAGRSVLNGFSTMHPEGLIPSRYVGDRTLEGEILNAVDKMYERSRKYYR